MHEQACACSLDDGDRLVCDELRSQRHSVAVRVTACGARNVADGVRARAAVAGVIDAAGGIGERACGAKSEGGEDDAGWNGHGQQPKRRQRPKSLRRQQQVESAGQVVVGSQTTAGRGGDGGEGGEGPGDGPGADATGKEGAIASPHIPSGASTLRARVMYPSSPQPARRRVGVSCLERYSAFRYLAPLPQLFFTIQYSAPVDSSVPYPTRRTPWSSSRQQL